MTEALLAGITRKPRTKAGLIIGLDATASREHCWDIATQLQSEMFQAAASAGGLEAQLVYYRGLPGFRRRVQSVSLDRRRRGAGEADVQDPLLVGRHANRLRSQTCAAGSRSAQSRRSGFVGDAAEEPRSQLISPARELAGAGVPAFMFLEGEDPTARSIFQEIASVTGGAFGHFDQNSARMLADLLKAVAAFAAGGRLALEAQGGGGASAARSDPPLGEAARWPLDWRTSTPP